MPRFASYDPESRGERANDVLVRRAGPRDLVSLVEISHAHRGTDHRTLLAAFSRLIDYAREYDDLLLVVAERSDRVVGYARAGYFHAPADAPANVAPNGWYLQGVVVRSECRRNGIGHRLTRERLDWIAMRAHRALYVANVRNAASIDLHRAFGFKEITRDFVLPGVQFEAESGGRGIGALFAARLPLAR